MDITLLKPNEVDLLLRYPPGRSLKLANAGRIPHIVLPDGEVRFDEADVQRFLQRGIRRATGKEVSHDAD